jgi:hypothetical protein
MDNTRLRGDDPKNSQAVFGGGNNRLLSLDYEASQLRSLDAADLDDRSAIIFASALDHGRSLERGSVAQLFRPSQKTG